MFVIFIGDKITGLVIPLWVVPNIHNGRKCNILIRDKEIKVKFLFLSKFKDFLTFMYGPQVKNSWIGHFLRCVCNFKIRFYISNAYNHKKYISYYYT